MSFCQYAQHLCGLPAGLSSLMDRALENTGSLAAVRQMQTGGRLLANCLQTDAPTQATVYQHSAGNHCKSDVAIMYMCARVHFPGLWPTISLFTSYKTTQMLWMRKHDCVGWMFHQDLCIYYYHNCLPSYFLLYHSSTRTSTEAGSSLRARHELNPWIITEGLWHFYWECQFLNSVRQYVFVKTWRQMSSFQIVSDLSKNSPIQIQIWINHKKDKRS